MHPGTGARALGPARPQAPRSDRRGARQAELRKYSRALDTVQMIDDPTVEKVASPAPARPSCAATCAASRAEPACFECAQGAVPHLAPPVAAPRGGPPARVSLRVYPACRP